MNTELVGRAMAQKHDAVAVSVEHVARVRRMRRVGVGRQRDDPNVRLVNDRGDTRKHRTVLCLKAPLWRPSRYREILNYNLISRGACCAAMLPDAKYSIAVRRKPAGQEGQWKMKLPRFALNRARRLIESPQELLRVVEEGVT